MRIATRRILIIFLLSSVCPHYDLVSVFWTDLTPPNNKERTLLWRPRADCETQTRRENKKKSTLFSHLNISQIQKLKGLESKQNIFNQKIIIGVTNSALVPCHVTSIRYKLQKYSAAQDINLSVKTERLIGQYKGWRNLIGGCLLYPNPLSDYLIASTKHEVLGR